MIVEAPTFLATIQCFQAYGAELITAPIDADGVQADKLGATDRRAQTEVRLSDPHLRQPGGAMLSLERRKAHPRSRRAHQNADRRGRPYGELYFGAPPPPSMLALSDGIPAHATGLPTAAA